MAKVLIVDDEPNILKVLSQILQDEQHIVYEASDGASAQDFIAKNDIDLAFVDLWLPDIDGLEILEGIKSSQPDAAVIMISGHASIDVAVKATKMGAYDFMEKPPAYDRIVTITRNALETTMLRKENRTLKTQGDDGEMIGLSPALTEIKETIDRAASTNARVFITGPNGSGKELVARAIYNKSRRSGRPFVKVNCAAIPDELIESELFGHEKGSFTGAHAKRLGKFEAANGGTIFLDEICDMSLSAQAKVLRVLQESEFERVGANETIKVDVRVIAATNVDVQKAIEENLFREDLYYRLNVIPIHVPPLIERTSDIPLLVDHYLRIFSNEHGIGDKSISESGMLFLKSYPWPGNVRQLKNIIERVAIMVPDDTINESDIEKYIESADTFHDLPLTEKSSLKKAKEQFEKEFIIKTLNSLNMNVTMAAKELGIERTNLHRKIKQYNIDTSR
ncbi:MAG: sigma-54-dependent Fis family transcriptional regulator [Spirochaetes bacterium]|nr:sigma-54-dependent Fis family transcriptional regulator [Spirochaetota bacterium]MBN2771130.1 sigma-54-dependent Fis family transcriptional regulator [Spirochaetota bacterium]